MVDAPGARIVDAPGESLRRSRLLARYLVQRLRVFFKLPTRSSSQNRQIGSPRRPPKLLSPDFLMVDAPVARVYCQAFAFAFTRLHSLSLSIHRTRIERGGLSDPGERKSDMGVFV